MRKIFVAYSKADSSNVDRLMVHLKGLEHEGIETWRDQDTTPGEEWDAKIRAELAAADVIIFCVSADLLATNYVQRIEIPKALARRDRGEATVIPVIIGKCAWEDSALGKLQGIPDKGSTVQDYVRDGHPADDVWAKVTSAVRDAVRSHHKTPDHNPSISPEIERTRRERLDVSPLERVKIYLSDPDAWIQSNTGINFHAYYEIFPEFTLKVTDAEDDIACNEEWTRGETRTDNNHAAYYEIHYHQTCLVRIRYVSFDDNKKSMVAPNWEPCRAGRFYFYEADSIDYAVQLYHSIRHDEDHSTTLLIGGEGKTSYQARSRWGRYMKIPILRTGELNEFLGPHSDRAFIDKSQNEAEEYESFLRNQLEFEKWRNGTG